jgi:parallel beta-helix repeat protein
MLVPAAGSGRIIFEDLRIDGVKAAKAATTTSRGIYIKNATEVRIHRLHITDCGHAGILVDGGRDIVITENFITGGGDGTQAARANGISVDTGGQASSDVVIANNVCTAIPDSGIGVHDNSKNVTITGNVIDGAGLNGGHGIDLAGCQQVSCSGNFVNCAATSDGIYVHQNLDAYSVLDVSITGNTIVGPGGPGCNGITVHGTGEHPADRLAIVGNTIRGMAAMGIYVAVECQSSVISSNVCHGNAGNGIMLDSAGSGLLRYVTVSGNACTGNGAFGLCLHPGLSGCKLFGNTLNGNAAGASNATDSVRWNNAWALNADASSPQDHVVHTSQLYAALSYPNKFTIASGAPGAAVNGQNPNTGDFYLRTDTPDRPNQRVYVCTLGGGAPTWVGIV